MVTSYIRSLVPYPPISPHITPLTLALFFPAIVLRRGIKSHPNGFLNDDLYNNTEGTRGGEGMVGTSHSEDKGGGVGGGTSHSGQNWSE